jgi:hypothetical protein
MAPARTTKSRGAVGLTLGLLFVVLAPSEACIHVPRTYKGTVTEKTKEALLFHDGVNAHPIIKTNLLASSGHLPDTMAWVIPLPSLPSHYEETNGGIFPEMFGVVEKANEERDRASALQGVSSTGSAAMPKSILVHPMQTIGRYQVQPIEVLDPKNAGSELNHWLLANGFGAVPPANQRYYLKIGTVFLTLKLHGLRGRFSDIKPLHIVYKSSLLSLPLKFSSHSGVFGVELYAFTSGPLDSGLLRGAHLEADPSVEIKDASQAPLIWQVTGQKTGYLTRFEGGGFNQPGQLVKALAADPTIDIRRNNAPPPDVPAEGIGQGRSLGRILAAAAILLAAFGAWRWRQKRQHPSA